MSPKLGWKRDPSDERDKPFAAVGAPATLPERASLRQHVRRILDQGQTSSCVAHAYAQAITICEDMAGLEYDLPSRLYLYHCARALTGDEKEDAGTYLRSGAKALKLMGAPAEKFWTFQTAKVNTSPTIHAHMMAHSRRGGTYRRIYGTGSVRLQRCLEAIASGYPFVFGTEVTQSFLSPVGPWLVDKPAMDDPSVGGHAMTCVGYDPDGFLIANSWGSGYRDGGFVWLSNAYMAWGATSDIWVVESWQRIRDARAVKESA